LQGLQNPLLAVAAMCNGGDLLAASNPELVWRHLIIIIIIIITKAISVT
jgi:hypothetical protein